MKILFLTRYGAVGASSRYRTYQYLRRFADAGISCTVSPLFPDQYLSRRYDLGRPPLATSIVAYLRRLVVLRSLRRFDLVVVEKELFPYLPSGLERIALRRARAYTLDFDDALFHIYDEHRSPWVRRFLAHKYSHLMAGAALVTAGNPYIAEYAKKFARRVEFLPTVVDMDRYPLRTEPGEPFTVGWIGTPHTAKYLHLIADPLRAFFRAHPGRLLLVGAGSRLSLEGVPVESLPWSEGTEAELLARMHVGIMPLPDKPLERGKSGLKLIQYMASSRPVIASPVGVNVYIVTPNVGFLASSVAEWRDHLTTLAEAPALRREMGSQARQRVARDYSLAAWGPRYARMLADACATRDANAAQARAS